MKRSIHLAVAATLLVFGAHAGAQGVRPQTPPVVKPAGAGAPNTKIMSTPSSGAAKMNVNTGAAMKAEKAQGAGSLAPPPPGNAAIKGESAAIKGNSAIGGSGAIKGESAAIKGNSAIGGSGAINGGTMKADKAQGAIKGAPAGALNSPRDPAAR